MWCLSLDGDLYDKRCELVKTIHRNELEEARGFTVSHTGHIIIACCDGLYECNSKDKHHKHIAKSEFSDVTGNEDKCSKRFAKGKFSDVTSYNGYLYALKYKQCELLLFNRHQATWQDIEHYKLCHDNGDSRDRVCVNKKSIYVSSYRNDCIFIYNRQGKFQQQIGLEGRSPGQFNGPLL